MASSGELLDQLAVLGVTGVETTINDDGSVSVKRSAEMERADEDAPVGATEWVAHGRAIKRATLEDALQALIDAEQG